MPDLATLVGYVVVEQHTAFYASLADDQLHETPLAAQGALLACQREADAANSRSTFTVAEVHAGGEPS